MQEICTEVSGKQSSLEALEGEGAALAQGFRSRETAAVKSRLAALRRQWEALCGRAQTASSSLSSHVDHWHQYQTHLKLIFPWLDAAERQLAQEVGRCASEKEATSEHEAHQVSERQQSYAIRTRDLQTKSLTGHPLTVGTIWVMCEKISCGKEKENCFMREPFT